MLVVILQPFLEQIIVSPAHLIIIPFYQEEKAQLKKQIECTTGKVFV